MLKFTKVCLYYWLYAMKNDEKNDENKMEVMKLYNAKSTTIKCKVIV